MNNRPLIKQPWIRVILFVVALIALMILMSLVSGYLLAALNVNSPGAGGPGERSQAQEGRTMLVNILLAVAASLITVAFFRKVADRQSIHSLGLQWEGYQAHAATGFFTALFLLGTGSFVLIANRNLEWIDINFNASQLFISLGLVALVSFSEELVFRGYILNNLLHSMNKWLALGISALLFAFFHNNNPGASPLALLNIFLAGLMLGVNYLYTRNLWFGILLHLGWNFYEGPVLGYRVSGYQLQSVLQHELSGNRLLTGGTFGFEGSVLVGLLALVAFAALAVIYHRKFTSTTPAPGAVASPPVQLR
jgi:membrane protease YdiL (CAAX protease family)